jgi:2-octaprenylphenol hydroxylase
MKVDVVIVGGGIAGLTLATALAQQTRLSILVLESQATSVPWTASSHHHRVSAITLASQQIFKSLGIWDGIRKKRISPFTQIQTWDENNTLTFASNEIAESVLGFIIENNVIQSVLEEKLESFAQVQVLSNIKLAHYSEQGDYVELTTTDGHVYQAKLAVAADGARSWLRQASGVASEEQAYGEAAVVATVVSELSHQQIASQRFLKSGPLAFLPLLESNTSSIVWSLPQEEAKRVLALSVDDFKLELAHAFEHRLGAILESGPRYAFPLTKQHVNQYIKSRVVLVGDAAHTIHPLAGQGVNMGLLDVASLTQVMSDAIAARRDFASHTTLRCYERWRKADNLTMLTGVDVIKHLFASEKQVMRSFCDMGLSLTNYVSWVKNYFTRYAVGRRGDLPKMAQYLR